MRRRVGVANVIRPTVAAMSCLALVAAGGGGPALAWSPEVNYAINCRGCHLADGSETPGLVPPLRGFVGELVRVPEGRDYLIRLPNVASTSLGDDELAALLNWVVASFSDPPEQGSFAPFTAAEIAKHRASPLVDVAAQRDAVLAALEASAKSR